MSIETGNKKAGICRLFYCRKEITSFLQPERQQEQQRQQQERLQPEQQQEQRHQQQEQQELQQQEQRLQEQEQLLPSYHKQSEPEPAEQQTERSGSFYFLNSSYKKIVSDLENKFTVSRRR